MKVAKELSDPLIYPFLALHKLAEQALGFSGSIAPPRSYTPPPPPCPSNQPSSNPTN